jgi:hypothetical protein
MQHFRGNNINISIFPGLCEEINGHAHPVFLFFFYDQEEESFWLVVVINSKDNHEHGYDITPDDVKTFIETQELVITTSEDNGHIHTIYFHAEDMQTEIIDPFEEMDLEDIEESEEED